MDEPKHKDAARATLEYVEEWLRRQREEQQLVPDMIKVRDTAKWKVDALDALREKSPGMATELNDEFARDLETLKANFPLPNEYEFATAPSSVAANVSTASALQSALISWRSEEPSLQPTLIDAQIKLYVRLQEEQGRAEDTARNLRELFPELADRFIQALDEAKMTRGEPLAEEKAAFTMRTFLHKLKGELFAKAKTGQGDRLAWQRMAERLSTKTGVRVLLEHESTHKSLTDWFSNVGKGRLSAYNFNDARDRFVDHVYVVCAEVLAGTKAPRH